MKSFILVVLAFQPVLVLAQVDEAVLGLIQRFVAAVIDPLITGLFALAFLLFMWGLLSFMAKLSTGKETMQSKQHMLWGLLGLVVMFSVAGIINVITNSLGDTGADTSIIRGGFE